MQTLIYLITIFPRILWFGKGDCKIYWGHWAGAKGMWRTLVFIVLKHGADTFFAVSGLGADTFFHYIEDKEKIFTEKMQLQLYLSLKTDTVYQTPLK